MAHRITTLQYFFANIPFKIQIGIINKISAWPHCALINWDRFLVRIDFDCLQCLMSLTGISVITISTVRKVILGQGCRMFHTRTGAPGRFAPTCLLPNRCRNAQRLTEDLPPSPKASTEAQILWRLEARTVADANVTRRRAMDMDLSEVLYVHSTLSAVGTIHLIMEWNKHNIVKTSYRATQGWPPDVFLLM